jgi:hypothetical protein
MDLLDVKTGLCNETHLISSHDGNEVVGIKIENTLCTDEEEEEEENGHMLKSFPSIKSEHGVRRVCAFVFVSLCSYGMMQKGFLCFLSDTLVLYHVYDSLVLICGHFL